jgi:hypothetical protein
MIRRWWDCVLQFALTLWVARAPLAMTAIGMGLLGIAPQAQDLFVEFAVAGWRIPIFLLLLLLVWAMPTHYAARLLLDTDARFQQAVKAKPAPGQAHCLPFAARWVPRALGLLTFVAVLIAIWRSHVNLPILDEATVGASVDQMLQLLAVWVLVLVAAFVAYVIERPRDADTPGLREVKQISRRLAPLWARISFGLRDPKDPGGEASRDVGRFLLLGLFVVFLGFFLFGADEAAFLAPRAMAVPFILGGWLPFLAYVSAASRHLRAPLILGLFVLITGLAVILGDNHSVRRINATKTAGHKVDTHPLQLNDAVSLWMRENGCENTPEKCPRPIVVAAAGGASRAGFFAATIIGYFLQEAPYHELDANQVRNRLFAISSVSGGSMGAVMLTAALDAKADSNDDNHPCKPTSFTLWWGDTINNWRDCFEALTSGDFLTANFFGFAFNDMLPFGPWRDRAAVLEDAWDDRYQSVITEADPSPAPSKCKGLGCPFLGLQPRAGHWIPLLVLNGTSEATGSRLVTTALATTYRAASCPTLQDPSGRSCILFAEADRFHDLFDFPAGLDSWLGGLERHVLSQQEAGDAPDDIRLSTAALNSARFPLISPAGSVRNRSQSIVDRIVDGGYFENYGALSAKELALAIHAIQPRLAPFVLVITNDPDDLLNPDDDENAAAQVALQEVRERQVEKTRAAVNGSEPVTDLVTPLTTFWNARTAHATLGVDQLRSSLSEALRGCGMHVIQVRVWPQQLGTSSGSRAVSMSWWLSSPVQRHLHQQTEVAETDSQKGKNDNKNVPRLAAVWSTMKATSECASKSR